MSFWEDLQAWTQAQYDALMLANLKRKKKWTAEDINRLLRDRISKRLKAKQGKAIAAEFLRTGGRIVPAFDFDLGPVEHGLLAGSNFTSAQTLHTYLALKAFLLSKGLTGMDANGSYSSTNWAGGDATPVIEPHRHSGLGILWAQAVLGAGRTLANVLPPTWVETYSPAWISLVRSNIGEYWLVKLQPNFGCALVKLEIPEELLPLEAAIRAGKLPAGIPESVAQATVLGQLTLPASWSENFVLYLATYDTIRAKPSGYYSSEFLWECSEWGWQWTYQEHGRSDEYGAKAIMALQARTQITSDVATKRAYGRVATVQLNWMEGGNPDLATLTLEDNTSNPCITDELLRIYVYRSLFYDYGSLIKLGVFGVQELTTYLEDQTKYQVPLILAAWYATDVTIKYVRWDGITDWREYGPPSTGDGAILNPGPGNASKSIAFGVSGGQGTITVGDGTHVFGGYNIATTNYAAVHKEENAPNVTQCWDFETQQYYDKQWEYTVSNASYMEWNDETVWVPTNRLTLLFGPPRTVWLLREKLGEEGTATYSDRKDYLEDTTLQWGIRRITIATPCSTAGEYIIPTVAYFNGHIHVNQETDFPDTVQLIVAGAEEPFIERDNTVITYGGNPLVITDVDWAPAVWTSYLGECLTQDKDTSTVSWTIPPDIPSTIISATTKAWIGGA